MLMILKIRDTVVESEEETGLGPGVDTKHLCEESVIECRGPRKLD